LQKFKGPYLEGRNDPNGTIGHYRFCINKIHKKEKKSKKPNCAVNKRGNITETQMRDVSQY
jgi:hypothetical protein